MVLLGQALQPVHERRTFLRMSPPLEHHVDRGADVDVLLNRHAPALADTLHALRLAAHAGDLRRRRILGALAELLASLLDRPAAAVAVAAAAHTADELSDALHRERRGCRYADSRSETLRTGDVLHPVRNGVSHALGDVVAMRRPAVVRDALCGLPSDLAYRSAQYLGYVLGHISLLPLSVVPRIAAYPAAARKNGEATTSDRLSTGVDGPAEGVTEDNWRSPARLARICIGKTSN